jgi:hypothetical protein
LKYISAISDLDRDTIIVAGEGALEYSISYDRGSTWIRDTMVSDTRYLWYVCRKVAFLPCGKPVGLWRQSGRGGGNAGILVGEWKKLGVTTPQADSLRTYMYPNPTTGKITFAAVPAEGVVVISDVCGREVGRAVLDAAGKGNIDLSPLPRGVYSAILMHGTTPLALGRISLTSGH